MPNTYFHGFLFVKVYMYKELCDRGNPFVITAFTCQGQFPGFASTPPITLVTGDLPHDAGGAGVAGPV